MNSLYIFIISSSILILLGYIGFLIIRHYYRIYDYNETLKENVNQIITNINGALLYFKNKYNKNLDNTIYTNIKVKSDFIMKLISKKSLEEQRKYYDALFAMLYETEHRLLTKYDDVTYVTAPLNNLQETLANEHIAMLKKYAEDNF